MFQVQLSPQDIPNLLGITFAGALVIYFAWLWINNRQNIAEKDIKDDYITKLEHEKSQNRLMGKIRDEFAQKVELNEVRGKLISIENKVDTNHTNTVSMLMQIQNQMQTFSQNVLQALASSNIERRK